MIIYRNLGYMTLIDLYSLQADMSSAITFYFVSHVVDDK